MKIDNLTVERGNDYGHPIDHFTTTQGMWNIWLEKREKGKSLPQPLEYVLRHIAYLVLDKLARMAENPYKQDNFDDIQGYASLWKCSVDEHEKRNKRIQLEDITD